MSDLPDLLREVAGVAESHALSVSDAFSLLARALDAQSYPCTCGFGGGHEPWVLGCERNWWRP